MNLPIKKPMIIEIMPKNILASNIEKLDVILRLEYIAPIPILSANHDINAEFQLAKITIIFDIIKLLAIFIFTYNALISGAR